MKPSLITRFAQTWWRRPVTPTRLVMSLTRRCNLRCNMCLTWKATPERELHSDDVGRTLAQMPQLCWLDITGGEPFVRTDLDDVFDAVLDNTPSLCVLHFPTNGWFADRVLDTTARILNQRPNVEIIITVSLDGPRDVHDAIRGRTGSFDRAIETLRALLDLPGVDVHAGTTVTSENAASLPALADTLRREAPQLRHNRWHWNWMQISEHFHYNAEQTHLTLSHQNGLVVDHLRHRGIPRGFVDLMEAAYLVNLEFHRRGEPVGMTCQALRSSCFLSPEGNLYPCHIYDRPLGNIHQSSIDEIWNAAATRDARRDIEHLACGGCFTPCEAYPTLAGAPIGAAMWTARRSMRLLYERVSASR